MGIPAVITRVGFGFDLNAESPVRSDQCEAIASDPFAPRTPEGRLEG
jgi:hypothetical protein